MAKNARWAHSQKTAGPLLAVSDWEEWLAIVQIYKEMKKAPGAEKTTHEWLRARFIFEMIIYWQE